MSKVDFFVPDWQSSGPDPALYYGAHELRAHLDGLCRFHDVAVRPDREITGDHRIIGYPSILGQFDELRSLIDATSPSATFLTAGTCGMEVMPVTYLNRHFDGDLTVVWFDAHADLNTPESSPSGTFHGMPLRTILGEGDEAMLSRTYSALEPRQVVLAGVRELDEAERSFAEQKSMQLVAARELGSGAGASSASGAGALHTALRAAGSRNVYVHIDFDVLDPAAFPGVHMPAAGGLTVDELEAAVAAVTGKYRLVGASMVELAPAREPASGAEIGDAVRRLYGALWR